MRKEFICGMLILAGLSVSAGAQTADCLATHDGNFEATRPCRVARITQPLSGNRLLETLYPLSKLKAVGTVKLQINICSPRTSIARAILSSVTDPTEVDAQARRFFGNGRLETIVTAGVCPTFELKQPYPLEVLFLKDFNADLVGRNYVGIDDLRIDPTNLDEENCRSLPWASSLRKVVAEIQRGEAEHLGIVGYYLVAPSEQLRARTRSAQALARRLGLDGDRLTVVYKPFTGDGTLPCSETSLDSPVIVRITER